MAGRGLNIRRRIRVKAVLLGSWRRHDRAVWRWASWEMNKGWVPAIILAGLSFAGLPVAHELALAVLGAGAAWAVFVLWNVATVLRALDRRRYAWLEAQGVSLDLSLLTDRGAWKSSLRGETMREFLKDRMGR